MRALPVKWSGIVVGLALTISAAHAAEWSQWRGNDRNGLDANSPPLVDSIPETGLAPRWKSEPVASDGGWGSPVVANGRVYLFVHTKTKLGDEPIPPKKYPYLADDKRGNMTAEQYAEYEVKRREEDLERAKLFGFREAMYCLDAATGQTLWKNDRESVYSRFLQSGSPAVVDGKLFILGAGRVARCIDAETGKDLWQTQIPGEFTDEYFASSFAVADGVAAVLAGYLVGLDTQTGKILWQGDASKMRGSHSSAVVWRSPAGNSMFIANVGGSSTVAVDPKTGNELWRVATEANLSTPLIAGDRLITLGNSRRSGVRAFKLSETGAEHLWTYNGLGDKGSSPVVVGDYVYAQGEKRLACVELATGKAAWMVTLDLANPQYTSLVAADGKVLYAYDGLLCFAASPADFQPLMTAKFDKAGLMATEAFFRERLKIAEVERETGGVEKAAKLLQQEVNSQGPLACSSPAIAGGKLYLRLRSSIACYDLSEKP